MDKILVIFYGVFLIGAIIEPIIIPIKLIHDKNHPYKYYFVFNVLFILLTTTSLIINETATTWPFFIISLLVLPITFVIHFSIKNIWINLLKK